MAATPEICRANGRKSHGAVTARGKAIASKNATKYGVLAKSPPILITEDLASFQGMVQSLVSEYQPQGATEYLLIQQVAMGWLRLHRLWGVEAALANVEMLKVQLDAKFPDLVTPASRISFDEYSDSRTSKREALLSEREILSRLIENFEQDSKELPKNEQRYDFDWLLGVRESSGAAHYHIDRTALIWKEQNKFDEWLDPWTGELGERSSEEPPFVANVMTQFEKLQKLAERRIQEIDEALAEIDSYIKAIAKAQGASVGIQNPELLARYEKAITIRLYDALDRLQTIQLQRQQAGSMGSFGADG